DIDDDGRDVVVSQERARLNSPLAANQIVLRPLPLLRYSPAHLNRLLQAKVLDALNNQREFLLVPVARVQDPNPLNWNHLYLIFHAASSIFVRSARPRK